MHDIIINQQKKYFLKHLDSLKEIFTDQELHVAELYYTKQLTEIAIVKETNLPLPTVENTLISLVGKIIMHRAGLFVKDYE